MSENKLKIKLTKRKPHKIYTTTIENDYHIDHLCKFLNKHKDKKLEIIINKKKFRFDSIIGRKKFVAGFKHSFSLVAKYIEDYINETEDEIDELNDELTSSKQEIAELRKLFKDISKRYTVKHQVMDLKTAAWEDRIQELEDNREALKAEIKRLKKI